MPGPQKDRLTPSSDARGGKPSAASGANADQEDPINFDDRLMLEVIDQWMVWRAMFPIRARNGAGLVDVHLYPRPNKPAQRAFHSYVDLKTKQQWFLPKFLRPTNGKPTQTLSGQNTPLWTGHNQAGEEVEHYTNIYRMKAMAESHPMVALCEPHNISKALDESAFDEYGRCIKHHQSPWNLKVVLEGSSLSLVMGCSVHGAAKDLLSLWFRPEGSTSQDERDVLMSVFFDIIEGEHFVPECCSEFFSQCHAASSADTDNQASSSQSRVVASQAI